MSPGYRTQKNDVHSSNYVSNNKAFFAFSSLGSEILQCNENKMKMPTNKLEESKEMITIKSQKMLTSIGRRTLWLRRNSQWGLVLLRGYNVPCFDVGDYLHNLWFYFKLYICTLQICITFYNKNKLLVYQSFSMLLHQIKLIKLIASNFISLLTSPSHYKTLSVLSLLFLADVAPSSSQKSNHWLLGNSLPLLWFLFTYFFLSSKWGNVMEGHKC